jgi:hypothetical protein
MYLCLVIWFIGLVVPTVIAIRMGGRTGAILCCVLLGWIGFVLWVLIYFKKARQITALVGICLVIVFASDIRDFATDFVYGYQCTISGGELHSVTQVNICT